MIEINDIEQMVYLFTSGIEVNTTKSGDITTFEIPMFGTRISFFEKKAVLTETADDGWGTVYIKPDDSFEEKKMEVIWELMKAGYFSYLRIEVPRTFKAMITSQGWDKKIIEKRLKIYGDDPKYNYWRGLNEWALKESSAYVLAIDPGFFDFLLN